MVTPSTDGDNRASVNGTTLLDRLADAKELPADFLRDKLGIQNLDNGGAAGIPYYGATGELLAVKRRTALRAKDGSYWPKGQGLLAYGEWRLQDAFKAGFVVIVEGETDCWTLWHHGIPALGIPGASATKTLGADHLAGVQKVYVLREPDRGGESFIKGIQARLQELAFAGRAYELRLPDGVKDPSELHIRDPERFLSRLESAIETSASLSIHRYGDAWEGGPAPASAAKSAVSFADPILASQLAIGGAAASWLWRGYLARGSVTLLTSLWKAGKSTLLAHLVKAMDRGDDLAGLSVAAGKVLVVSEESAALWARRRDKLGIGDHAMFYVRPFLGRPDAATWLAFIEHLAGLVRRRDLALVCLDTLATFSPCDDENDAAKMLAALSPLHQITEAGAALLLSHHPRKGDGGEGQASRGSGALPGFVDVILEMRRVRASERSNRQRELTAYSRYDDTPAELVIELAENGIGYRSLGSPSEADRHSRWEAIRDLLPGEAPGKTAEELLTAWPEARLKPGKRTLETDLTQGAEAGRWSMTGAGKRGDPFRFWCNGNSFRADIDPLAARNETA